MSKTPTPQSHKTAFAMLLALSAGTSTFVLSQLYDSQLVEDTPAAMNTTSIVSVTLATTTASATLPGIISAVAYQLTNNALTLFMTAGLNIGLSLGAIFTQYLAVSMYAKTSSLFQAGSIGSQAILNLQLLFSAYRYGSHDAADTKSAKGCGLGFYFATAHAISILAIVATAILTMQSEKNGLLSRLVSFSYLANIILHVGRMITHKCFGKMPETSTRVLNASEALSNVVLLTMINLALTSGTTSINSKLLHGAAATTLITATKAMYDLGFDATRNNDSKDEEETPLLSPTTENPHHQVRRSALS